jgi:hypothetical protein
MNPYDRHVVFIIRIRHLFETVVCARPRGRFVKDRFVIFEPLRIRPVDRRNSEALYESVRCNVVHLGSIQTECAHPA